jgi:hypothetical protein
LLPVSIELKQKLRKLNEALKEKFPLSSFDQKIIKERLRQYGTFYHIKKWDHQELKMWLQDRSIVGVDGSVNSVKGTLTRTFSVFQALARGTKGEEKWAGDVYTSLEDDLNDSKEEEVARQPGTILSGLELKVTMDILRDFSPQAVFMDGSLLHFCTDHVKIWFDLVQVLGEKKVYMIGITEEMGSNRLAKKLFPEYPAWSDRDILYGVLKVGEAYEWEEWSPLGSDMWKMAFRSSINPQPIGVEGLLFQQKGKMELLKLIFSLTPEQGRGIPFWLDIIDNQVRITDSLVQTLMEQYIDPDLRHRLFRPKRGDRII